MCFVCSAMSTKPVPNEIMAQNQANGLCSSCVAPASWFHGSATSLMQLRICNTRTCHEAGTQPFSYDSLNEQALASRRGGPPRQQWQGSAAAPQPFSSGTSQQVPPAMALLLNILSSCLLSSYASEHLLEHHIA